MAKNWFKRLEALMSPRLSMGQRLEDRIHKEILVKGEDFDMERKEGIELLGELMLAVAEFAEENGPYGDVFGTFLTDDRRLNARAGQFFTPVHLCDAMVAMTMPEETPVDRPLLISDPACGSGRFMLRTAKYYAEKGQPYNFVFYNADIDFRMYVYCALNAILHMIPSVILLGDSLAMTYREGIKVLPRITKDGNVVATWSIIDAEEATVMMVVAKQVDPIAPLEFQLLPVV